MDRTSTSLLERLRLLSDEKAWDRFVELYTPLLYHWTHQVGLSDSAADDLVQQVFAKLVEELPTFEYDPGKSFRAWLKTILLNEWRMIRRRFDPVVAGQGADMAEIPEPASSVHFWNVEYQQKLAARALELIQTQFQSAMWKAFWESVVNDRAAADVARELGITVNAVYIAKSRVLTRLREELGGLWE